MTGQYASVDENLTATENLWSSAACSACPPRRAGRRRELLEEFGLEEAADNGRSRNFSGGMRRRLDLAASLIPGRR